MDPAKQAPENRERLKKIDRRIQSSLLRDARRRTSTSIWILVILATANYAYGTYYYFETTHLLQAYLQGVVATAFLMLALHARANPYQANLIALVLYLSLMLIGGVADLSSLWSGIIFKIAVMLILIKGMRAGKDVRDIKTRLNNLEVE